MLNCDYLKIYHHEARKKLGKNDQTITRKTEKVELTSSFITIHQSIMSINPLSNSPTKCLNTADELLECV